MSSSSSRIQKTNSEIRRPSASSAASDEEDFIDEDDDEDDNEQINVRSEDPNKKGSENRTKNKKTQGRVKIDMAYIDNKVRRYTTFSKRKTGIMKKAYELATLTGTEVMLLVASETGHVYTYATPKLQPMITSEAGKTLIQTCLAKDEPILEPMVDTPTPPPSSSAATTLNNNDVIFVDENQRKKRTATSTDSQSIQSFDSNRPFKRAKSKPSDELLSSSSLNKSKSMDVSNSNGYSVVLPSTTCAVPLPCLIPSDSQSNHTTIPASYTIDLNALKTNGMNIIFAPSLVNSPEQTSISSNSSLVFTLGNLSYQSS